ncbi:exonuclease SbcC [Pseudomonas frederiksbergensis]|uniref:AAA family ATPase n=1 Tax=Pseudomonas frederiksbergensis TaxID=104087 RepID=UPI003D1D2968
MKIKKVEIEAFRAYKLKSEGTFDFTNAGDVPSDFVAIFAPNGFGKSSFYDAVEWAVTNHLERLGGEYNKANYESAARITKYDKVGQKILRNKYADKKMATRVVVDTTRPKPFSRTLPTVRSNGRDLRIGNTEDRENDYFRRVILSQDEIDRFLREAKPQQRYEKFMESFGGQAEIARKELTVLMADNSAELINLNNQREELIAELEQPVDLSIFERFNAEASKLNDLGENITLADEGFSSQSEHALSSSLVSRQHELTVELESNARTIETLSDRVFKTVDVELQRKFIEEKKDASARLSQGVIDADNYQLLLDGYNKCKSDLQQTNDRLGKIVSISENLNEYFDTEARLGEIATRQKSLGEARSGSSSQLLGLAKSAEDLKKELKESDERALFLRNSIDNAGPIYSEMSVHRARVEFLGQHIAEKEIAVRLDKSKLSDLAEEIKKVSALKVTSDFLLFDPLGLSLIDQDKIDRLTRCFSELDTIKAFEQTVHTTQKALTDQMGVHERLIATGIEYLNAWPSHVCPLCSANHESADELLDKVKGQHLLSALSQENTDKLALSRLRKEKLLSEIDDIARGAAEVHILQLTSLQGKSKDLSSRLDQAEREKSTFEAEKKALEHRISELEKSVWNLTQDELIQRAEAEVRQLSEKRADLMLRQTGLAEQIDVLKNKISENDLELQVLVSEYNTRSGLDAYLLVLKYLTDNALSSADLRSYCDLKKAEVTTELENHRRNSEALATQCNTLQQKMQDDGNWVEFSLLRSQKESLGLDLARSQSAINAFYESLAGLIDVKGEKDLGKIKSIMTGGISNRLLRNDSLERLVNGFKLLLELMISFKPYVKRLSLQQDLAAVELKLDQRNKVNDILFAERGAVIQQLKTFINNFFYEDLINSIYRKIDPHPSFKKVEFKADFDVDKPGLNIVVSDEDGVQISPILYFSAAQSNILSLSVFLASALHAVDDKGNSIDVIMIDDPIQSMDSINILSTIDLLRSICLQFKKQIIISTHDENFFGLLQRKIPAEIVGSKFLQLEKFGVVVPVEPFLN